MVQQSSRQRSNKRDNMSQMLLGMSAAILLKLSGLFVPACCSKWLGIQLVRMVGPKNGIDGIGIEVEVHLEVDKVQIGGCQWLTGGRKVLAGGGRIQREAQQNLRRSSGHGRKDRQAMVKQPQAIPLSQ